MTSRPSLRAPDPGFGRGLSLILAAATFFCGAPAHSGAQVAEILEQRRADFEEAQAIYEAARASQAAQDGRFRTALAEVDSAKASGNQRQIEGAYASVAQRARELQRLDRRVEETAAAMEEARDLLVEALDAQMDEYLAVADTLSDSEEADRLATILQDLDNQYRELRELEPEIEVAVMPEITRGPRDGPEDLLRYASLLDFRGDQFESNLADIDQRLEQLRDRQGTTRQLSDFLASIGRFGDTQVPVTVQRTRTEAQDPGTGPPSDSVMVERTLEEEIQDLELLRERVMGYLQEARMRANRFRREAGGVWA